MTQDTGSSQPGYPRYPAPNQTPSNPYSAGPVWPGSPGAWGQRAPSDRSANSVNAISIVQLAAGIAILVSLLLSWFDVSFSYLDSGSSSSFVSIATDSEGLGQLWLDLILLGVAFAVVASVVSLSMRVVARATSAVAVIGFGLVAIGAGYYLADGNAWDYSVLSPGPGVYLCLLAAAIGGLAAVAHLANPRLGGSPAVSTGYWGGGSDRVAPPQWSAWPGATNPGPTYPSAPPPPGAPQPPPWHGAQYPSTYTPARTWPPQPLAPTYPAPTYPVPPYGPPAPVASVGSAAQLVVLEAGQSRLMSVQPGEQLLVGRDPDAQIRLADPAVQARHATIGRRGNAWVVRDLQTASPSSLMDATGSIRLVIGETTVEAGQLLVGSALLTLYPGRR